MSDQVVIRVSADVGKWLHKMAEKRGQSLTETADRILKTAKGRLEALDTYAKKQAEKQAKKGKKAAEK